MTYIEKIVSEYVKGFKVNNKVEVLSKNGSNYVITTYKVYNRYYYTIMRYNSLFGKFEFIKESVAGDKKEDLKNCVSRQLQYLSE